MLSAFWLLDLIYLCNGWIETESLIFILFSPYSHRHQDDHKCEKLEVQKPRMAATKELVQKIVG